MKGEFTMNKPELTLKQGEHTIVISRSFEAPRQLVWQMLTNPEYVMRWWGPEHFTSPVCKIDLRVGGSFLFCMRSPESQDFWSTGTYREIVAPERLVYSQSFADENGNIVPATHYGMAANIPLVSQLTVTLDEIEKDKTQLTLHYVGIPAGEMKEMATLGWKQSFDKIAASLAALQAGGSR
jgi:uncharacterized protein YndB with AHSA1/START domain